MQTYARDRLLHVDICLFACHRAVLTFDTEATWHGLSPGRLFDSSWNKCLREIPWFNGIARDVYRISRLSL